MYKIEIDISEWELGKDKVTIETSDYDKIAIIQEFIEFQQNYSWCVDYDVTDEYDYYQSDEEVDEDEVDEDEIFEDEEIEEVEIGEIVEDDDGMIWKRLA